MTSLPIRRCLFCLLLAVAHARGEFAFRRPTAVSARQAEAIKRWQDMRFGMFIHWGPVSLTGEEIGWSRAAQTPIEEYDNLYKRVQPDEVQRRPVGRHRQGGRHEVHRADHQAPRRLLPL